MVIAAVSTIPLLCKDGTFEGDVAIVGHCK